MKSDFAIVSLAGEPALAALCGCNRVLVEAVEMHGAAILIGAAREWTRCDDGYIVPQGGWFTVPAEHSATLERLFVEARRATQSNYIEARHSPKAASKPLRPGAPVRYSPGKRSW